MKASRASRYQLDRVILGLVPENELSAEDRVRLESLRNADAERGRKAAPPWLAGLGAVRRRRWTPSLGSMAWTLAPTAALVIFVLVPSAGRWPEPSTSVRAKGASRVDLVVQRGDEAFAFDGRALRAHDTLVFRYSSTKRHLVLAGREDGGPLSVYASLPVEPGQDRVAETGVRLDDYRGGEWFYALLTDREIDSSEALLIIDAEHSRSGDDSELFRFRIEREPR